MVLDSYDSYQGLQAMPVMAARARTLERLWLLDPELEGSAGHFSDYARAIVDAASRLGFDCRVVGNRAAESALAIGAPVEPVFHHMSHQFVPERVGGLLVNPLVGSYQYYRQLCRILTPRLQRQDMVFVATANHRHLWALGRWLNRLPARTAPALCILLRYSSYDIRRQSWLPTTPLLKIGLRRLEQAARVRRVHLVTDSEPLAAEYRRLTTLSVTALPIPHLVPESVASSYKDETCDGAQPPRTLRFVSLGGARDEKGFHLLPGALRLLAQSGHLQECEFIIQCYRRRHLPNDVSQAFDELVNLELPNVRVVPEAIGSGSYYRLLMEADAVLLPYRRHMYFARNSGIFTDALAVGKPVITTAGTWMSSQLEEGGAGVLCADDDPQDLARAIRETCKQWGTLNRQAQRARPRWIAEHSMENFLKGVLLLFQ